MILKNILGGLVLSLFTVGFFLFFRAGVHKSVTVEDSTPPDYQFFYTEHVGPYHEIMPKLLFVEEKFRTLGIECPRTFGFFLSDPKKINHDKLKSQVGCAFNSDESPKSFASIEGLGEMIYPLPITDLPITDLPITDLPITDLPITDLPSTNLPITDLPITDLPSTKKEQLSRVKCYKGSFTGSPSLSAIKIYPKIKLQAKKEGVELFTPALEIYEKIYKNKRETVATTVYLCGTK